MLLFVRTCHPFSHWHARVAATPSGLLLPTDLFADHLRAAAGAAA